MKISPTKTPRKITHPAGFSARIGAGSLLALILAGLLADLVRHDEAYAGIDYGLSLLAFLGATGCIACLAYRLSARPDPLPWARSDARRLPPPAGLTGGPARGEDWPVLIAILFGQLPVLLAGLGGWV